MPEAFENSLALVRAATLPPSVPDHIRQAIEREIIEGRLAPGERVGEDALARLLGVSRTPVREAMRLLEGQGLIVRHRDRGAFVAQRTTPAEALVIYELRVPLERFLAAQAAEQRTAAELESLVATQREFTATSAGIASDPDAPRRLAELDSTFHLSIYHAARSDLAFVVESYWGRLRRELYDRIYTESSMAMFVEEHDRIVAALRAGDSDAATIAIEVHIVSGRDALAASYAVPEP
jgi:DNA-binding GntR family transcriptional regulator